METGELKKKMAKQKDIVCGMEGNFTIKKSRKGKDYYFCSGSCEWMFVKDPENYE